MWLGSPLQILWSVHNDLQMCCEMRRVTLNCTHDSIMAAALRAIQILSVWLILCNNQPIMARSSLPPSDSEKEKDDNNDEEEVEDNHPILPRPSVPPSNSAQTIASVLQLHPIWTIARRITSIQYEMIAIHHQQRARQSLLIKFVCICQPIGFEMQYIKTPELGVVEISLSHWTFNAFKIGVKTILSSLPGKDWF